MRIPYPNTLKLLAIIALVTLVIGLGVGGSWLRVAGLTYLVCVVLMIVAIGVGAWRNS